MATFLSPEQEKLTQRTRIFGKHGEFVNTKLDLARETREKQEPKKNNKRAYDDDQTVGYHRQLSYLYYSLHRITNDHTTRKSRWGILVYYD